MDTRLTVDVVALLVASRHAFEGRPSDGPRPDSEPVGRESVTVRAGLGLVGDRYFNRRVHRDAAVTVFAVESLAGLGAGDPLLTRRNITVHGFPVDDLARGAVFSLDTGDGPVRFRTHRPANPCAWMDVVIGPGAFRGLRGHGGLRCEPLDDGVLRLGPAVVTIEEPTT